MFSAKFYNIQGIDPADGHVRLWSPVTGKTFFTALDYHHAESCLTLAREQGWSRLRIISEGVTMQQSQRSVLLWSDDGSHDQNQLQLETMTETIPQARDLDAELLHRDRYPMLPDEQAIARALINSLNFEIDL